MSKQPLREGFTLAGWHVEPLQGQLIAPDGKAIHITPKAMDVLLCLAAHAGEVVERTTIFEEVWGNLKWSDEALTHCVGEIRHALNDKPEKPEFLQTIPKRGYRLLVPVDGIHDEKESPPPDQGTDAGFLARQFLDLRKRKVFQTVIGYPVLAWLLVQIVDILWQYLLEPLGAPAWIAPTFVVLLALGYPVAIFLTWAVDLTPHGVRLTGDKTAAPPLTGLIVLGVASVSVTVLALFLYFNAQDKPVIVKSDSSVIEDVLSPIQKSVAVLRFLNISNNPAIQYISDGLTEELIHELTNLRTFKVPARTTIWSISDSKMSATEIAAKLQVENVLEGSIRTEGDQIRVTAQLIGKDGFHVWSQAYDKNLDDPLQTQKDIANKVVKDLELILDDSQQARLNKKPTTVSDAYDQYLRGRQFLRQPSEPSTLSGARTHFEAAIQLDSRFPLAYAGLCEVHLANYRLTRSTEHFEKAELACHRALTLDGGLAEVYTALGNLYRHSGQNDKAEKEYEIALSINPMLEEATFGLGRVYQAQGQLMKAEEALLRTVELEPAYWGTYFGVGNFLFRQGRYADAVPYYTKVTELEPEYAGAYVNLGSALFSLGEWDAAEVAFRKSIDLSPDSMGFQNLGTLFYYSHDYANAAEMHRQAIAISPSDHRAWGKLAAAQRYVDGQESSSKESYAKAIELVEAQLAVNPDEPEDLMYLASYQVNTNRQRQALASAEKAIALAGESPSPHYFAAVVHNRLGNTDKSLDELVIAANLGYSLKLLASDPQFDNMANLERFKALFH